MFQINEILNLQYNFDFLIKIGDLHTKWNVIEDFIKEYNIDNTCFFQVGDFGLLDDSDHVKLSNLNQFLENTNNVLYVIRGNHDNPKFFVSGLVSKYSYSNVILLPDYSILEIWVGVKQVRILGIGGAESIDRKLSTVGIDYWPEACVNFNYDKEAIDKIRGVDIIVTHTAPEFVQPYGLKQNSTNFVENDPELLDDLKNERKKMTELIELILKNNQVKYYFYGHFHFEAQSEYKGMICNLLAINQFKEVRF